MQSNNMIFTKSLYCFIELPPEGCQLGKPKSGLRSAPWIMFTRGAFPPRPLQLCPRLTLSCHLQVGSRPKTGYLDSLFSVVISVAPPLARGLSLWQSRARRSWKKVAGSPEALLWWLPPCSRGTEVQHGSSALRAQDLLGAGGRDRLQMPSADYGKSDTHHTIVCCFLGSLRDIHQESKTVGHCNGHFR